MTTTAGRTAIVTGVSRSGGIGAAVARHLAGRGTALLITGWSPHDAEQPWGEDPGGGRHVADELRRGGARAEYLSVDLADPDAPRQVVAAAIATAVQERMPAGQWGRPDDAARLVTWLLSDEAEWVTGQTIASDGDWSAR